MKNVLLLTNIYPVNDKSYSGTPVCHYFTREWVRMGYNVRVVHFESLFPRIYYGIGKLFNSYIQAKTGCVAYTNTPRKCQQYMVDDVPVIFVPMRKIIPHSSFSPKVVADALKLVRYRLEQDSFVPDIITAHFLLPQLEMLYYMKKIFPNSRTCMVLHSNGSAMSRVYKNYEEYMKAVDVWGFRSVSFRKEFEKQYGKCRKSFICFSGIPEKYLTRVDRDFNSGVRKFVFVGSLYKLKRVEDIIKALSAAFPEKDFTFEVVGGGEEEGHLRSLVKNLGVENRVHFHGQVSRDSAQKIMNDSDCFIMVSSREAFGLVYVEAMAKGCIVIATKGQGMDGIIKNGENGFLCEAENINELASLIKSVAQMPLEKIRGISQNAVMTASGMTDKKAAEHYINQFFE